MPGHLAFPNPEEVLRNPQAEGETDQEDRPDDEHKYARPLHDDLHHDHLASMGILGTHLAGGLFVAV